MPHKVMRTEMCPKGTQPGAWSAATSVVMIPGEVPFPKAGKRPEDSRREDEVLPRREKRKCKVLAGPIWGIADSQPGANLPLPETSAAPLTLAQGISISGQVEARGTLNGISPSGMNTQSARAQLKAGRRRSVRNTSFS